MLSEKQHNNKSGFYGQCKDYFSENELADFERIAIIQNVEVPQVIRIGNAVLANHERSEKKANFPLLIPFRDSKGLAIEINEAVKDNVHLLIQLIALRLISYLSKEVVRCHFVDADHFGASFPFVSGLHERIMHPNNIITTKNELGSLLTNYSGITKTVISRRLTHKFKDLADYNRNSGSSEPYHFLFIANFPGGFSKDKIDMLARIIYNGAKAGIYVILSYNRQNSLSFYENTDNMAERLLAGMPLITDISPVSCQLRNIDNADDLSHAFDLRLDGIHNPVSDNVIESIISRINKSCAETGNRELKEDGIRIPIGKAGHKTHYFTLGHDSGVYHALAGGETGSGKTVLLHNIITRCIANYSPDDLKLWLLDYKEGVEFNVYQHHPNVEKLKLITGNVPELGIEVLRELQAVISKRGELFKAENTGDITRYNQRAGRKLPRILVIIDEFQKLLEGKYQVAKEVNMLLEDVAKRGRSFGIHLVLCSQSLANTQLEKTTLNQIGLRIVFKIHKSECPKFLDYNNEAPAMLTKKGEAIYNTRSGLLAGNEKIQVDYIDEGMIAEKIAKGYSAK
ncbi:MAG: DUF2075 domain-containing protein [Desulfobacteraceae bacterium]|nr:DUF2075 domain-containing protein [Desulfobacteraceae bacterium]